MFSITSSTQWTRPQTPSDTQIDTTGYLCVETTSSSQMKARVDICGPRCMRACMCVSMRVAGIKNERDEGASYKYFLNIVKESLWELVMYTLHLKADCV